MDKFILTGILIATLLSMVDHRAPIPQNQQQHIEPATQQTLSLGKQIQLARIKKGFSQKYLARMTGVTFEEIVAIEKEKAKPTLNELYKFQEILGGGLVINGDALARL